MKKLMIAAAAGVLSLVSFAADCCNTCDTCSKDCVYAYEFILLAKSTEGKPVTQVVKSTCACECDTVCGSKCYRKPRMRKYAGFVVGITNGNVNEEDVKAGCGSACTCLDFATGACVCGSPADLPYFDAIEDDNADGDEDEVESKVGIVTLAGFGTRGKRGNDVIMVKNLSGFFAGQLPVFCQDCVTSGCDNTKCTGNWAVAWTICSDKEFTGEGEYAEGDDGILDPNWGLTAAYGKWTLKWNATAVAKLTKNYNASVLVKPGYDGSIAAKTTLKAGVEEEENGEVLDEGSVWGGQLFWDVRTKKAVEASLWFYQLDAIGYKSRETIEAVGQFALKQTIRNTPEEEE